MVAGGRQLFEPGSCTSRADHHVRRLADTLGRPFERAPGLFIQVQLEPELAGRFVRREHRQRRLLRLELQRLHPQHLLDEQAHFGAFVLREVDAVLLPGIEGPQAIFEILGHAGRVSTETAELRARYEAALGAYRRGDWATARRHFRDCLAVSPEDGPARTMLERVEMLAAAPRSEGWNGVWPLRKEGLP